MTNREKLFEILNKMTDEQLAFVIDLPCDMCPARKSCESYHYDDYTCQDNMTLWLEEGNEQNDETQS